MLVAVIGLHSRTGSYWLRDLICAAGIPRASKDDYPLYQWNGELKSGVFRTARINGISNLPQNTRVLITIRNPLDMAANAQLAFNYEPLQTAKEIAAQLACLEKWNGTFLPVFYETMREQWGSVLDFLDMKRQPFPNLPRRGATSVRPVKWDVTNSKADGTSGAWKNWKQSDYEQFCRIVCSALKESKLKSSLPSSYFTSLGCEGPG